jgi:hypothetical protein
VVKNAEEAAISAMTFDWWNREMEIDKGLFFED